jgi:hypothetical protein
MAAYTVAMKWFGKGLEALAKKLVDLSSDTIKVALTTSAWTPDQDAHDFFNDVTNEVSATGYTAGGATLANKALTYTGGTNVLKLDADDVVLNITGSLTARNVVLYDATPGTAGTNPLLGYGVFLVDGTPGDITVTDGSFTIAWDSNGILKLTAGT